jgi:hypothetical protein
MALTGEELEKIVVARTFQIQGLIRGREILIAALLRIKEKLEPAMQGEIETALQKAEAALTDSLLASNRLR